MLRLHACVRRELTPSDGHPVVALSWSPSGDAFLAVMSSAQPRVYDRRVRRRLAASLHHAHAHACGASIGGHVTGGAAATLQPFCCV
jgi:hypothetical protein